MISGVSLGNEKISWINSFKYLGVNFVARKKLLVDINDIKGKFFVSCNCILGNIKTLDDLVKLNLWESYCLSILAYAIAALKLSTSQLSELNACWNSVYRPILNFNLWESMLNVINGLGRLDFVHFSLHLQLKFVRSGTNNIYPM